jgi:hypothetical protein
MAIRFHSGIAAFVVVALVGLAESLSAPVRAPREAPPVMETPLPAVSQDMKINVKNIAALLKAGNSAGATKLAQATVKAGIRDIDDIADLMHLYKPRNKGGIGWGPKPQPNPAADGLERGVLNFAKQIAPNDLRETARNEEAAYSIAAMAELTAAAAPAFNGKPNIAKDWVAKAERVRGAAFDLAKASAAANANGMRNAAANTIEACVSCHAKYK